MAGISSYVNDESVQATDKLLGSNAGGETKNFRVEDITTFLNTSGTLNLNGVVEQFIINDIALTNGKFKLPSGGNGIAFSSVTSLKVSLNSLSNINVSNFFNHLVTQGLKISRVDNIDEFGQYILSSVNVATVGDTYATFTLTYLNGNSTLREDKFYLFNLDNTGRTDKNFLQSGINFTAGTPVTITHNLTKFPSVTTVDSAGSHIVGDIQHVDSNGNPSNNHFTITFKASFQGSVYVN